MRILYFGFDFFDEVLSQLTASREHEVVAVFTKDSPYSRNVRGTARAHDIPVHCEAFSLDGHEALISKCDLMLAASYDSLIPLPSVIPFKLNLHPSLLPMGRGPAPLPWILNAHPEAGGVTLHEMTDHFDEGPILSSRLIDANGQSSFERYCLECNLAARDLIAEFCADPPRVFAARHAQGAGAFFAKWPEERFAIDASMTVTQIEAAIARAGPRGASYFCNDAEYRVTGCIPVPYVESTRRPLLDREFYAIIPCQDGAILVRTAHLQKVVP